MVLERATEVYRRASHGRHLTAEQREALVKPLLPAVPTPATTTTTTTPERSNSPVDGPPALGPRARRTTRTTTRVQQLRNLIPRALHIGLYHVIHLLFALYLWCRQTYHAWRDRLFAILYHHHRSPELIQRDVKALSRLPDHLSVILTLGASSDDDGGGGGGGGGGRGPGRRRGRARARGRREALAVLLDEAAEIAAWCASAGIPTLSIYERTGRLKTCIPDTHRAMAAKLYDYFGTRRPTLHLRAPHLPPHLNGNGSVEEHDEEEEEEGDGSLPSSSPNGHLSVLLISAEDGRDSLVDLTKTLAEMSQRGKLSVDDITLDLVDVELTENVMAEPDLLVLFTPYVELQGYPPWQVRLTEIFHVQDCGGVGYQVFLRALHRYAKAQMRFGR
ncbi:MAG: hypothetical protein M1826_005321 [Phylliscum demangeonii]|nr:MAG: hypothetical protein M1826_005321 [Phylliscum demangeonii]